METLTILRKLSKRFPKRYAKMNHDHVGLMTGKLPKEVHKILLCLDCDEEIYNIAKKDKPDLIISHHPFIFGTKYQVFKRDLAKKELCEKFDKLGVPIYSMHTNFDTGLGGMNDALASALDLQDIKVIEKDIMMRGGRLIKPMNVNDFAKYAKDKLNVDYGLLLNYGKPIIETVAIIGGGGSRGWTIAKDAGYDIYISGDAPHYVRRDIVNNKYNYLDLPHEIEKIFMPTMKKLLLEIDPSLQIIVVDHEKLPIVVF